MVKALFTDMGWESTAAGMQVLGGHGYIREWGMEQYVRDARITQIYEGTNGVQALDLVGRKMSMHAGRYLRRFFHPLLAWIEAHADDPALAEFVQPLAKAFTRLQQCTAALARRGLADPTEAAAGATDYLRLFGLTALAWVWARAAEVSLPQADNGRILSGQAGDGALLYAENPAADGGVDLVDPGGRGRAQAV